MPNITVNSKSETNDATEKKEEYTPPLLTVLLDLTVAGNVGNGADAGGYSRHNHS